MGVIAFAHSHLGAIKRVHRCVGVDRDVFQRHIARCPYRLPHALLNGLDLPRNSRDQFRAGTPIKRSALRQGDLVFFATGRRSPRVTHVGIYTGGGRFIHAPGRGKTIRSASLTNGYFKRRFVGARRYF